MLVAHVLKFQCTFLTRTLYLFTLPDTETDKKLGCVELCGGVRTAQRQTSTQIPIGYVCLSRYWVV